MFVVLVVCKIELKLCGFFRLFKIRKNGVVVFFFVCFNNFFKVKYWYVVIVKIMFWCMLWLFIVFNFVLGIYLIGIVCFFVVCFNCLIFLLWVFFCKNNLFLCFCCNVLIVVWKLKIKLFVSFFEVLLVFVVVGCGFCFFECLFECFLFFLKGWDFLFFIGFIYFFDILVN